MRLEDQVRAVRKHLLQQRPGFRAWILAEFARRQFAETCINRERCRLLSASVEGKHELHMRMLGQWVSPNDRANLLKDIMMLPEGEPCIDQPLAYVAPLLDQRVRGQLHDRRLWQVGEWRVTPQGARLAQQSSRTLSITAVERGSTLGSEFAESDDVELTLFDQNSITGLVRDQPIVTCQRTPQITHADTKRCFRIAWQVLTPERINQLRPRRPLPRP